MISMRQGAATEGMTPTPRARTDGTPPPSPMTGPPPHGWAGRKTMPPPRPSKLRNPNGAQQPANPHPPFTRLTKASLPSTKEELPLIVVAPFSKRKSLSPLPSRNQAPSLSSPQSNNSDLGLPPRGPPPGARRDKSHRPSLLSAPTRPSSRQSKLRAVVLGR